MWFLDVTYMSGVRNEWPYAAIAANARQDWLDYLGQAHFGRQRYCWIEWRRMA